MKKNKRKRGGEITHDYLMLVKMSKDLQEHQKRLRAIGARIARARTYNMSGLVDNLSMVMEHMGRAKKELDKASRELKMI